MAVFHPRARLDSYVEGMLPPSVRERISAHLAQCDDCRREAEQRERILRAATSLSTPGRPPSSASRAVASQPYGTTPVLEARDGLAGWKVVVGLGVLGAAAVGVLSIAWIAGDPAATDEPDRGENYLLLGPGPQASPTGPVSGQAATGAGALASATVSPDGTGTAATGSVNAVPEAAELFPDGVGTSSTAGALLALVLSADSEVTGAGPAAGHRAVELPPSRVNDLRSLGWNVPSLSVLGLDLQAAHWLVADDVAEVVLTLDNDRHSLVLHECRSLAEDRATPTGCPEDRADGGADSAEGTGNTRELPVGIDMSVVEHADGSWTATTQTAQAAYTVTSDLPVERADRIMSLVVISERSWVQTGTAPERPADRLARGFDRLLPWAGDAGAERE
jgi:hypothetical protein